MPRRLAPLLSLAAALVAPSARADADGDGAYGRLRGDVAPSLEAGLAAGTHVSWMAQARLLYLSTVGVQATLLGPRQGAPWAVSVGGEMRPLFLARFLKDLQRGPSRLDLALDSIGLGLAARVGPERSPGFDLTLGFELPVTSSYSGVFLGVHWLRHWSHEALVAGTSATESRGLLTLGFRGVLEAHAVDANDRVLR